MGTCARIAAASLVAALMSTPVWAQRVPFDRSFDVDGPSALDVSTIRGAIEITVGAPGRIIVAGMATVRIGWDVPANAAALARQVADNPPIERDGHTIRLRPPSDAAERRVVTVSYQVQVPATTQVSTVSESGATTVRGVSGPVAVSTQSGTIELGALGGTADVTSGSGSVAIDGVAGAVSVKTSSSGFTGRSLSGSLRVRTQSGAVDAVLSGEGDVDVQTGSSAIRLSGVRGALIATSESGRLFVQGAPRRSWDASTGSGSMELSIDADIPFAVDAASHSGSVTVHGVSVQGATSKRTVTGAVGGGGPLVRARSRSGSVRLNVTTPAANVSHLPQF